MKWSAFGREGYQFEFSKGLYENVMMGLPLDDDNEPEKTRQRVTNWIYWVMEQFGMPMPVPA
ncbi:MAG: hypothetical protein R2867_13485 [Caldilineaceae bacterium]